MEFAAEVLSLDIGDNLLQLLIFAAITVQAIITHKRTKELKPNGGSSLYDKMEKVYQSTTEEGGVEQAVDPSIDVGSMYEKVEEILQQIHHATIKISDELTPNHGNSLHDKVERIYQATTEEGGAVQANDPTISAGSMYENVEDIQHTLEEGNKHDNP